MIVAERATLLVAVIADALEERAVAIARDEGALGVTVLQARGLGFPEHVTFFGLTYRGLEKVLLWALDSESAERIAERLNRELDLLAPFQGLAFSLGTDHAEGLDSRAIHCFIQARRENAPEEELKPGDES